MSTTESRRGAEIAEVFRSFLCALGVSAVNLHRIRMRAALKTGLRTIVRLAALVVFFSTSGSTASSQVIEVRTVPLIVNLFERRIGEWRLIGPVQAFFPSELAAYDPDRGEVVREYGLREAAFADFTDGRKTTVRVEIFRMINYVSAYGIYSCERRSAVRLDGIGTEAELGDDHIAFWKGDYYVRLSLLKSSQARDLIFGKIIDLARAFAKKLVVGPHELPLLLQHLPTEGLVPGTERFIAGPRGLAKFPGYDNPDDIFLLSSDGVEAAIGDYRPGSTASRLLLVEYHTPQLCKTAYDRVNQYFQSLPQSERDRRILKREGNYLIEAFDVQDRPALEKIVGQIRYTAEVRWLKEKIKLVRAFPEFPAVQWLLTTFLFIGLLVLVVMGCGALIGYSIFVWRRRRMRRFGFTDAGGMLRLNLDRLVLPPPEKPRKSLPAGG